MLLVIFINNEEPFRSDLISLEPYLVKPVGYTGINDVLSDNAPILAYCTDKDLSKGSCVILIDKTATPFFENDLPYLLLISSRHIDSATETWFKYLVSLKQPPYYIIFSPVGIVHEKAITDKAIGNKVHYTITENIFGSPVYTELKGLFEFVSWKTMYTGRDFIKE